MSRKPRPSLAWYAPGSGGCSPIGGIVGTAVGTTVGIGGIWAAAGAARSRANTIARMPVRRIERTVAFSRRARAAWRG